MILNKNIKTVILVANRKELSFSTSDNETFIYEIGVGKVNALLSIASLYEDMHKLEIQPVLINVGTVGSTRYPIGHVLYPSSYAQGDVYTDGFFLENTVFLKGQGKLRSVLYEAFDFEDAILTSDRFVHVHSSFYEGIKHLNPLAFDMESFALANFCFIKNIAFHSIKIVSDNCDGTVKDWENILSEISGRLGDILGEFLKEINVDKSIMH